MSEYQRKKRTPSRMVRFREDGAGSGGEQYSALLGSYGSHVPGSRPSCAAAENAAPSSALPSRSAGGTRAASRRRSAGTAPMRCAGACSPHAAERRTEVAMSAGSASFARGVIREDGISTAYLDTTLGDPPGGPRSPRAQGRRHESRLEREKTRKGKTRKGKMRRRSELCREPR